MTGIPVNDRYKMIEEKCGKVFLKGVEESDKRRRGAKQYETNLFADAEMTPVSDNEDAGTTTPNAEEELMNEEDSYDEEDEEECSAVISDTEVEDEQEPSLESTGDHSATRNPEVILSKNTYLTGQCTLEQTAGSSNTPGQRANYSESGKEPTNQLESSEDELAPDLKNFGMHKFFPPETRTMTNTSLDRRPGFTDDTRRDRPSRNPEGRPNCGHRGRPKGYETNSPPVTGESTNREGWRGLVEEKMRPRADVLEVFGNLPRRYIMNMVMCGTRRMLSMGRMEETHGDINSQIFYGQLIKALRASFTTERPQKEAFTACSRLRDIIREMKETNTHTRLRLGNSLGSAGEGVPQIRSHACQ